MTTDNMQPQRAAWDFLDLTDEDYEAIVFQTRHAHIFKCAAIGRSAVAMIEMSWLEDARRRGAVEAAA